jgi:isoleucyl-tRNA synthetase
MLTILPASPFCSNFALVFIIIGHRSPVTVAFPLVDDPKTSLLAWTTTPWTLPSNLALCVHPDYNYIKIHDQDRDENYILHENLLKTLYKDLKKAKYKKVGQFKGSDMGGWRYVPLFEYFTEEVTTLARCFVSHCVVNVFD